MMTTATTTATTTAKTAANAIITITTTDLAADHTVALNKEVVAVAKNCSNDARDGSNDVSVVSEV